MKRLLILLLPTILFAAPAQVIITRHAEIQEGTNSLRLKGRERAAALTPYFAGAPEVNFYGTAVAIYSPKDSPESMQTMQPFADSINTQINNKYLQTQIDQLTSEILTNPDYEGHSVVVCWTSNQIPTIAAKLGAKKTPKNWDDSDYDRLWILTFSEEGQVEFKNQPQKLMYGDSK